MFRKDEVDGKVVIENSGNAIGKVKDIAFGLNGSVVLIVTGVDSKEVQISMDRIEGVGDYIVVRKDNVQPVVPTVSPSFVVNPTIPPPPTMTNWTCRTCGAPLKTGAKFCTKCGTPT
jgi:sporulation protein YlmC with PRC-barrel domain